MFSAKLAKATAASCTAVAIIAIAPVAAYGQSKPVTVVNPTTSPVNARITNSVVPVEVSNAAPIRVTVNPAAEQVVQVNNGCIAPAGASEVDCGALYSVPAGKRLVVEYASASFLGVPETVDSISGTRLLATNGAYIELTGQTHPSGRFVISQPVTFYVGAGGVLSMTFQLAASTLAPSFIDSSIVGRLVNVP